jgi:hypothetical protein
VFVGNASNIATARAVSGDLTVTNLGVWGIATGVIVNADINASAAIAVSKLAALNPSHAVVTDSSGFLDTSAVTTTELGFSSGLTGSIQAQLDGKQNLITGGATTITSANLSPSLVLVSTAGGKVTTGTPTVTEINRVAGVTSPIQTQLDAKLTVNVSTPAEGDILYYDGSAWTNIVGGSEGDVLTYQSDTPTWDTVVGNGLPTGGTANQYLNKIDGTDFNVQWSDLTLAKITDVTALAADVNVLFGADAAGLTSAEIQYSIGVTAPIQDQIDGKLDRALGYNNLLVGSAGGIATAFAPGTDGDVLTMVGTSVQWSPAAAAGDVTGPASSTNRAIATWNGTAGDALFDNIPLIDASGNITAVTSLSTGQVDILNQAALRLHETGSTNYVGVRASGVMAGDYTITLPAAAPGANTALTYDGADYVWAASGGAVAFTDLTDAPASYTGEALKFVRVNAGETGLEFSTVSGTGTVTSVTGTASRIVITGTPTVAPVIDIDAAYVGQASITTLGTITTGTWNGTTIAIARGGTGLTALGTASQLLRVNAGATALEYFTPTYISANQTITLSSDVTGSGTTGIVTTIATNAVTDAKFRQSAGLSVVGRSANSTGNVADITAATDGHILRRSGTAIGFGTINLASSNTVGVSILQATNGGTGLSTVGTSGQVLITNTSGAPAWSNTIPEEVSTTTYNFTNDDNGKLKRFTNVSGCTATIPTGLQTGWSVVALRGLTAGTITFASSGTYEGPATTINTAGSAATLYHRGSDIHVGFGGLGAAAGSGTVTSVALAAISGLTSVSGSPIVTSGTLTQTLSTQSANTIFAGPTAGASATPAFRAMVLDDLPNDTWEDVTGATYTFLEADNLRIKRFTNAAGCAVTIPNGLSTGWQSLAYRADNAGTITFSSATTLEGTATTLSTEMTAAVVAHRGSNIHVLLGALGSGGGGGITNSAAANELMKSDATNAVPSGIFVTTNGSPILGSASISGDRDITVASSSSNSVLKIRAKGTSGSVQLIPDTATPTTNYFAVSKPAAGGSPVGMYFTTDASPAISAVSLFEFRGTSQSDLISTQISSTTVNLYGGTAAASGTSKPFLISGTIAAGTKLASDVWISGGDSGIASTTAGSVLVKGGENTGATSTGGSVTIRSGVGTTTDGNITIDSLTGYLIISTIPTSSAGLPSGAVWANSNVLTIVP